MALTTSEKKQLLAELRQIQTDVEGVTVRIDLADQARVAAQARIDDIERILAADVTVRVPPAELT